MNTGKNLAALALACGADNSGVVDVKSIQFDSELRKACEANHCGHYGKNWTCPPHVGEIDELIDKAKRFKKAVVFQTINRLKDSFDFEGMEAAGEAHEQVARKILNHCKTGDNSFLLLSAGGCRYCKRCQLQDDKPCTSPENAIASLEAHGIFVTNLAAISGMNYINGQNTVTFFGAVLI